MDSQQARDLVRQHKSVLEGWVAARCVQKEHLIPLVMLYLHERLSEQDWKQVRQYDGEQPFTEFIHGLVENALETFFCGVWFGESAKAIRYWVSRYGLSNDIRRQDAEDYIKDELTRDNFARFKSFNKNKPIGFNTYVFRVIRNLFIDYSRKKTRLEETDLLEGEEGYDYENAIDETVESYKQQSLNEIGQWFFADSGSDEKGEAVSTLSHIPDKIRLSHKERLFLRAIYKDGMTAEEAGSLPGLNMGKWQAHGHHQRLKRRIKKLLKAMGYKDLQSLLHPD